MKKTGPTIPIVFLISIMVMLFLSVQALYMAYSSYQNGRVDQANYYLLFGAAGMASSIYALTKLRVRVGLTPSGEPEMLTEMECSKCGFKSIRKFVEGDYVMKEVESCPKCNTPLTITSIYQKETKEKGLFR